MLNYNFQLNAAYCLYNGAAVLKQKGSHVRFLMENIENEEVKHRLTKAFNNYVDYVRTQTDCPEEYKTTVEISFEKGNKSGLRKCISALYEKNEIFAVKKDVPEKEEKQDAAAILLLENIIEEARKEGATDIHIEKNCVYFREGGCLVKKMELQKEKSGELVLRIKVLSGMNVMEKRKSQDGHFVFDRKNPVYVRTSSMGIVGEIFGGGEESIVLRLLDSKRNALDIQKLGFSSLQLKKIAELAEEKSGLILVAGPTGAGKSTTSAAILKMIQEKSGMGKKIISLEDPPEYYIPEITQIQIDDKRGDSFEKALKHIFRQDPDVIAIGEIRDEVSAVTAVRAALTGHLVFATVHILTAGEGVLRLEELGIRREILLSVLKGIICQELQFAGGERFLAADAALLKKQLPENHEEMKMKDELDLLFNHFTNYRELLGLSVNAMFREKMESRKGRYIPPLIGGNPQNKREEA